MSQHLQLVVEVTKLLDRLKISYVIGGSVASSLLGEPRSTIDVDIAVKLSRCQLQPLLTAARPVFYIPEHEAQRAVDEHDSFNLIHSKEAIKVDLFVLGSGTLDHNQMERRITVDLPTDPIASVHITSAEDQVLRKLDWHQRGGSPRQWRDVVAILRLNHQAIDQDYLRVTAGSVGLSRLLARALSEAEALRADAGAVGSGDRPALGPLITDDTTTPPPAVPIAQMNDAEYRRFINMLIWLVQDEAEPLGYIGGASTENGVPWGPWPTEDCSEVLQRWYEAGLLRVHRLDGQLADSEAQALLADSAQWASFGYLPEPFLASTVEGSSRADAYWFDLVRTLRDERK